MITIVPGSRKVGLGNYTMDVLVNPSDVPDRATLLRFVDGPAPFGGTILLRQLQPDGQLKLTIKVYTD